MSALPAAWCWTETTMRLSIFWRLPWWQPPLSVPPGRWERVPFRRNKSLRDRPPLRLCSQGHVANGLDERRIPRRKLRGVSTTFRYQTRDPNAPEFPPEGARQPGDEGSPAVLLDLTGMLCHTEN